MASRRPLRYEPVRRMTELVLSQGFPMELHKVEQLPDGRLSLVYGIGR